ncbi:MAG: intradiol ring-cleavage dioxygenase [Cyanobacteria bacterium J06626_18]
MSDRRQIFWQRRAFLRACPPLLVSFVLATCSKQFTAQTLPGAQQSASGPPLAPTPACDENSATPSQTAGPFYTPNSPERQSLLEPGITGMRIVLTGQVLAANCTPVAGALLDFWHTNDQGEYDNKGYTLRGHQFADADGRYWLETIVPGFYPGRTRHFHVRVQAPDRSILTTQLYFPEEASNLEDGLFQPALLMAIQNDEEGQRATFNFVLG